MNPLEAQLRTMGARGMTLMQSGISRDTALSIICTENAHQFGKSAISVVGGSFALAWAECGYPTIEPAHKLAASLMATRAPQEILNDLVLPWRCFGIRVPDKLFSNRDGFCLFLKNHYGRHLMISLVNGSLRFGDEPTLGAWSLDKLYTNDDEPIELDDPLTRETRCLGRLLLGCCIEMSQYHPSNSDHFTQRHTRRNSRVPQDYTLLKLTRPVTLDLRHTIHKYLGGIGNSPTIQTLVRGHWKQQPCGPAGTERKFIHIEPYWRGPEDAPIGVRPHLIR